MARHNEMDINIPPNLNSEEIKCFNEVVKPQLQELYSYNYNKFEFKNVDVYISKEIKNLDVEKVKQLVNKFSKKDLTFVSDIYFVHYKCKDDTKDYLVNGRTLPIIHKILIYPRAHKKLSIILAHEIGHVIFEKKFNNEKRAIFINELIKTFPQIILDLLKPGFASEYFANCYGRFVNSKEKLERFQLLNNFFIEHVK